MADTTTSTTQEPWIGLRSLLLGRDTAAIESFLDGLSSNDLSLAISRLSDDEQRELFLLLTAETAAEVVQQIPDAQAVEVFENLDVDRAAAILDELPSAEQADLLGDLDAEDAAAILGRMDPEEADDARRLCGYEDDVAGGLMVTEFLEISQESSVEQVVQDLRANAEEYSDYDIQYGYVINPAQQLTGVLRMRDLLLARGGTKIASLMIAHPLSVRSDTPLDALIDFFDSHSFLGVPVVDPQDVLLGVVQRSAVDEAASERQDSDYLKSQGIVGGEEMRSLPTMVRAKRRLSWLSVNILLNIMAASVIAFFQDTLAAVIALAVFLPIISDMSGCSGSQAVAVSLRELSLGLVRTNELFRVWVKEVSVGLINGVALGILIAIVAVLWKGNAYLGLVVGSALALNTMVAVSIGGIIPLLLKRWNIDPAIAAGPILTTITDMCGFFFVLGFASLMLDRLV